MGEAQARQNLSFWIELAKLRDTFGLPADIIWCKLRDSGHPIASELSSERFEKELDTLIKLRQGLHNGRLQHSMPVGADLARILTACGA